MEDLRQEKAKEVRNDEKASKVAESARVSWAFDKKVWIISAIIAAFLIIFLFLDWRVRDVCRWSRFEEMPSFSERVDLISSIFKMNTYHIYFVLDYKDYESKEKLLNDVTSNQKEIEKQLKKAGLRDDEITVSSLGEIYAYEVSTSESEKTLFGMNGVTINIKMKNKKLYELFSSSLVSISRQPKTDVQVYWPIINLVGHSIQRSSREVFSFSITKSFLKILDCTRVNMQHCTLVEEGNKYTYNYTIQ